MRHLIRMTAGQHERIKRHVLPADGREAAAVLLCGRGASERGCLLVVRDVHEIPHDACSVREPDRLVWPTQALQPLILRAMREKLAIVKVHGHPGGYASFSSTDDQSDHELFRSVHGWTDDGLPHASMIFLPDGSCIGRMGADTGAFTPVDLVQVVGDQLRLCFADGTAASGAEFMRRHEQAFGEATTGLLRRLRVAVIGVSGTGEPLVEQLVRLGVGGLVLVDPDHVEKLNLNRLPHATTEDARSRRAKVDVTADAIRRADLGTDVVTYRSNLKDPRVIREVSTCDLVFGCMDGAEGRHLLNRIATFYSLPYIDVGVRLDADGRGGINQICGSVHWLQPGGSSLLSRGVITLDRVRAEGLRRQAPEEYARLRRERYIKGVDEERPAVISVNTMFASLAVCELLARLHPYRDDDNANYARLTVSLTQTRFESAVDGPPCSLLARHVGRGDTVPLLDDPELTEEEACARSA